MMNIQVKYCGCRSEEDYRLLTSTRADIIGFVFADSKRKVRTDDVKDWVRNHGKQKKLAGVFQNASIEQITDAISGIPLDIIQCHGNESVDMIDELKRETGMQVFKAIPFNDMIFEQIAHFAPSVDAIIVDSVSKGQFGGTGIPFSWSKVPSIIEVANRFQVSCFIAGGITPENVDSLLKFKPFGIDMSGGIEEKGSKSSEKIQKLEGVMFHVSNNRT
jgi:phosphoribosylanthranilate isomerase